MCDSRSAMSDSLQLNELLAARLLCRWNSSGKNTGVDSHSLLQGIFLTQGSNPGLLHCRQILYTIWATREADFKCINSSSDWATFSCATFKFKSLLSDQIHLLKERLYLQPRKCKSFAFWDKHATLAASMNIDPGLSTSTEAALSYIISNSISFCPLCSLLLGRHFTIAALT